MSRATTRNRGFTRDGIAIPFFTEATHLEGSRVSLFSVPTACKLGHTVLFEGDPTHGLHGMYANGSGAWIPFVHHPITGLWYLRVHQNPNAEYGSWLHDNKGVPVMEAGADT